MPARIDFRPAAPFQRQRGDPPAKVRRDGSDGWRLQRRRSAGLGWHARRRRANSTHVHAGATRNRSDAGRTAAPQLPGLPQLPQRRTEPALHQRREASVIAAFRPRLVLPRKRPLAPAHSHASAGPKRHIETKAETKPHPPREHRSTSRRCASSTTATMTPRAPHRARQTTRGPHAAHHCMRAPPRRLVPTRIDTPRRLAPSASSPSRPSPYRRGSSRPARHRFRCRTGAPRSLARSRPAARAARRRA